MNILLASSSSEPPYPTICIPTFLAEGRDTKRVPRVMDYGYGITATPDIAILDQGHDISVLPFHVPTGV